MNESRCERGDLLRSFLGGGPAVRTPTGRRVVVLREGGRGRAPRQLNDVLNEFDGAYKGGGVKWVNSLSLSLSLSLYI